MADARVIDVVLEPGEVFEATTVEAAELDVQTTGGELSGLVTGEQIRDLPLNGRNLMQLTLLQPGVIPADFFNAKDKGLLGLSGVAASGGHAAANMWTVDGVNNNEGGGAALLVFPSSDTVEEFRIHRNSYGAEFGQASGAQINVVTRGGANAFHGGVFYSMRDELLSQSSRPGEREAQPP